VREGRKKGEKGAGDAPYRNAELPWHLLDNGKRWSSSASGSRGAVKLGQRRRRRRLGLQGEGGGCGVDGTKGAGRRLYRAAEMLRRAGSGRRTGGGDVPQLDSG
jgi:hypothetical protein